MTKDLTIAGMLEAIAKERERHANPVVVLSTQDRVIYARWALQDGMPLEDVERILGPLPDDWRPAEPWICRCATPCVHRRDCPS